MPAYRDRNGIMYFAPGGPVASPYSSGGFGPPTPINYPPAQTAPAPAPVPAMAPNTPPPPTYPNGAPPSTAPVSSPVSGLTTGQFGQNPYNTGIPLSNTFVAQTPSSNMAFNAGQYSPQMQQAGGNLGSLQDMLMSQANGGGPNLAAEQLKQGTSRNIAQAYAMAQASGNDPGGMRNVANQVGGINQQAASDAAQQRMQQQLAAQGQLGQLGLGVYGTSGRLMTDAQKLQLEQAQGNQQAALNAQTLNAQTSAANQQYGANVTGSAINSITDTAAKFGGSLFDGKSGSSGGTPTPGNGYSDPGLAPNMPGTIDTTGTTGGGDFDGGGGDTAYAAYGGMISPRHYDMGGFVPPNYNPASYTDYSGKSEVADPSLKGFLQPPPGTVSYQAISKKPYDSQTPVSKAAGALVSNAPIVGGFFGGIQNVGNAIGNIFAAGGPVPGHAQSTGNAYENDTVKAMLSPGEIVLPRSVTQSDDAAEKAKAFVAAIKAKKKKAA